MSALPDDLLEPEDLSSLQAVVCIWPSAAVRTAC